MYCDFYQLTERPFNVTPDPKFLYLNARYREAIASLNYGITQRKGFITLIGEAGTGKTTLLKKLLEDLDPKTKSVFIFNTNVSFEEILEYIFAEFDLPIHNGKKLYMLQRLNAFLLEELRGGGNVALLIDEAQDLEFAVLEDLRLLSNLETAKEKILQIVLSGQPELGQKLSNPVLRQLRQRIGINCRLLPLSRDEITEYIHFRLQAAGAPDLKLFTREAEDQIYHFSRGIPRLVNVVCDNALVIGYALGKKRIGAEVIGEAAADLLPAEPALETPRAPAAPIVVQTGAAPRPPGSWRNRFGVSVLVAAAALIGVWSVGRTTLNSSVEPPAVVQPKQVMEVIRPGSEPGGAGIEAHTPPNPQVAKAAEPETVAVDAPRADAARGSDGAAAKSAEPEDRTTAETPPPAAPQAAGAREGSDTRVVPEDGFGPDSAMRRVPPAASDGKANDERAVDIAKADGGERGTTAKAPAIGVSSEFPGQKAHVSQEAAKAWVGQVEGRAPNKTAEEHPTTGRGTQQLDSTQYEQLVVRDGDSMSEIARRKYGQSSYTVLDLLKMANPGIADVDVISPGQTVRLPELRDGFPILSEGNGRYALLVFSTPNADRAGGLGKALRGRGFDAQVSPPIAIGSSKRVYRVTVAAAGDHEAITTVGRELQKLFREDTRLAQLGE